MKSGLELIIDERNEQLIKHGRTTESDVEENDYYQLALVAQVIMFPPAQEVVLSNELLILNELADNWDQAYLSRLLQKPYKDRLVIAAALLAAEIDRIQYLEAKETILDGRAPMLGDIKAYQPSDKEPIFIGTSNEVYIPKQQDLSFDQTIEPAVTGLSSMGEFHDMLAGNNLSIRENDELDKFFSSFERTKQQEGEEAFWKQRWGNSVIFEPSADWVKRFTDAGYFVTKVTENNAEPIWRLTNYDPE